MKKEEYIDPFSKESEMYAKRLDNATISGDIEKLETLLNEIESVLPHAGAVSQARLYYSIGTIYSYFANAHVW